MKVKTKQILLGFLGFLSLAVLIGAMIYPEDFATALVGLVLGLFTGITLATVLMESYFHKGATMAHDLHKQQVFNPATIMRENRLAAKEENKSQSAQQQPKSKPIPQFNVIGLDN